MESVVRRSGALLHSYISLHETVFLAEDLSLTHGLMGGQRILRPQCLMPDQ